MITFPPEPFYILEGDCVIVFWTVSQDIVTFEDVRISLWEGHLLNTNLGLYLSGFSVCRDYFLMVAKPFILV